jgi:serine/threonine-protein kinase HipA
MKVAKVFVDKLFAGKLEEIEKGTFYRFSYDETYKGQPVSLEMPIKQRIYEFQKFPPFFEGLLPEGIMLESLLRISKIDRHDLMSQLLKVGEDLVGNVTIEAVE